MAWIKTHILRHREINKINMEDTPEMQIARRDLGVDRLPKKLQNNANAFDGAPE